MKTIKDFIKIVNDMFAENKISNSFMLRENEIREILLKSLSLYISDMRYEEKTTMSSDIFNKFEENKELEKIKKAKVLFGIYSKRLRVLRNLYFVKWKRISTLENTLTSLKMNKRIRRKSNLE